MRRFNFLSMVIIAVLMVTFVSCTTLYESAGDYEEAPTRRRVYTEAPYGYGGQPVIILERDPLTGRYYQVSPFGYYGSPYNYGYDPYRYRGGGVYRGGRTNQPRQQPQPQQPQRRGSETTDKAKDIIRGN